MTENDLDIFIAEKVMGWIFNREIGDFWDPAVEKWEFPWSPTRNILSAMRVIEKLRVNHTVKIWTITGNNWRVSIAHGVSVSAWADTLPLAICKAAQAAVEASAPEREGAGR